MATAATTAGLPARYLIVFAHKHLPMRVPELESVARLLDIRVRFSAADADAVSLDFQYVPGGTEGREAARERETCYLWVEIDGGDANAQRLAERMLLCQAILEVWGHGATWDEATRGVAACAASLVEPHFRAVVGRPPTFSVRVDVSGHSYSREEKLQAMHDVFARVLPVTARVSLEKPDVPLGLWADHGVRSRRAGKSPPPLRHVYAGRIVGCGPGLSAAEPYRLPKRRFLGPTSMDHELSMLIATQALARPGSLVLDPFCGTASILVGCAHYGARVLGADLDGRLVRGAGEGRNIGANFDQYELEAPVGLLRADFAEERACWRRVAFLDAVVCDPPYGVRASSKRLADDYLHSAWAESSDFIPRRQRLETMDLLERLLTFAADVLVVGGRLVCFVPVTADMRESPVPRHPAFKHIAESVQPICSRWARRLVTLEKVRHAQDGDRVTFESVLFQRDKLLGGEGPRTAAERRALKQALPKRRVRQLRRAARWGWRVLVAVAGPVVVGRLLAGRGLR